MVGHDQMHPVGAVRPSLVDLVDGAQQQFGQPRDVPGPKQEDQALRLDFGIAGAKLLEDAKTRGVSEVLPSARVTASVFCRSWQLRSP